MNYYRRYMADYLSKTAGLSMLEHGAYNLLLDYSYLADGILPGEKGEIYRIVRAISPPERAAVDKVLGKFFFLESVGYLNARVSKEIEKAKPAIEAARENGRLGGRPPKNPPGSGTDNPPGSGRKPSAKASQPLTTNRQPSTPIPQGKDLVGTSPDVASPEGGPTDPKTRELRAAAVTILTFLNEKAGRRYEPVPANINPLVTLLRSGQTVQDIRAVIAMKCRQWSTDEKMVEYLRPKTLFSASNFAQYKGALGAA